MTERVSADFLREIIEYDPCTGSMEWKPRPIDMFKTTRHAKGWNTKYSGKPALNSLSHGYLYGRIFGVAYLAHRAAWAITFGDWPEVIDHQNGNRADNRITNLRDVTLQQNLQNCKRSAANQSGATGVFWLSRKAKWQAGIKVNGKYEYLGIFHDINDAIAARKAAELHHGFHPNHGGRL